MPNNSAMDFNNNPQIDAILKHISNSKRKLSKIDLKCLSVNGKCLKEPMSDYLARKAIQSTNIKECSYSPKAFWESYNNSNNVDQTPAMELGTFVHSAILEPDLFRKFVVKPYYDLRKLEGLKDSIRFYNRLEAFSFDLSGIEDKGRDELRQLNLMLEERNKIYVIDEDYRDKIHKIETNLKEYQNGLIPELLRGALTEVTMYCVDPITGLPVKIRTDAFNIAENIGVDAIISVKTTSTKNFSEFISQSISLQYELSEAFYQDIASHITGRNFTTTIMIIAQTIAPYHVYVSVWEDTAIQFGRENYQYNLAIIKECFDNGHFPAMEAKAPLDNGGFFQLGYPDKVLARQEEYINI